MQCRDYSTDCALMASTGQCATSASTRLLCPLSCGIGCSSANGLYGTGVGIMDSLEPSAYGGSGLGYGGYGYQQGIPYGGYPNYGYGGPYEARNNGMCASCFIALSS